MAATGSSGLLNGLEHRPDVWSPNKYDGVRPSKGITVHHMAATAFDSAGSRFSNQSQKASAHYGVGPGYWCQYVSEDDGAWHGGCDFANLETIGIECVNSTGAPDWRLDDATLDALARLMADIAVRHGWAALKHGTNVWGHREMTAYGAEATACPGPYLWPRLDEVIAKANAYIVQAGGKWVKGTGANAGRWWWLYADGTWPENKWLKINGSWYWFNSDGWASQDEWVKIKGTWYWFKHSCKAAQSEVLKINGKWYAFDANCHMLTSIQVAAGGALRL